MRMNLIKPGSSSKSRVHLKQNSSALD